MKIMKIDYELLKRSDITLAEKVIGCYLEDNPTANAVQIAADVGMSYAQIRRVLKKIGKDRV